MGDLSRRTFLWGSVAAVGVWAAGCAPTPGAGQVGAASTPTPTAGKPTASPSVAPAPTWPLTGRELRDVTEARHAAVAVKVPDNEYEHPQSGLNDADLVFVEMDGYLDGAGESSTRLVPVFHSSLPEGVIPVRSMRPVDVPLLAPIGCVLASTGGAGWVVNYAEQYPDHIDALQTYMNTKGTGSFSIDASRVYTYGGEKKYDRAVTAHPRVLSARNETFAEGPARPYLPFATGDAPPSTTTGVTATRVEVPWKRGDSYTMSYDFDHSSGTYLRNMPWGEHVLVDGERVSTDNILIIRAAVRYDKIFEGSGGTEPIHEIMQATGAFHYCHSGKAVTGSWAKGDVDAPFTFTLDDGSPLEIAPGRTFVELPQADAAVTVA